MNLKKMSAPELSSCVAQKIKQVVLSTKFNQLGEKLIVKQQLELAPFKEVKFTGWSDWEKDPLKNRSWQWRLNWLSFLSYLISYHKSSSNDGVLDFAREAVSSWLDAYLKTDESYLFEFIWHDHATALRAEQLLFLSYYCQENATEWSDKNKDFLLYLEQALVVHGNWLAKDSFYSEHTNHGLEQARVLLLLGTSFQGEGALKWQQIAVQRISSELSFSFTKEGVHVENSPAYHIFVFKLFLNIIKDYPEGVLGDLAEQFGLFSNKALSFITHILRPDAKLPPIGDTEQLPTSDGYKAAFGDRKEYHHFLYALSQGKKGVIPQNLNRVYVESGYAVFRDEWLSAKNYTDAFHLIIKVGCLSRYHHQQDEGHVSIYAGGEDWLIDSGLYNYINQDPVRKYMRSRLGHNVPLITHATYAKDFQHRLDAWKVLEHSEDALAPSLTMQIDVLEQVSHTRRVTFDSVTKIVEIGDMIYAKDAQKRMVSLQWHFPRDKTITIDSNRVLVASPTGNKLIVEFEGDIPDEIVVLKGQKEDRVFSCISYKANQVEPSQLVRVVFKNRKDLKVISRFIFDMLAK